MQVATSLSSDVHDTAEVWAQQRAALQQQLEALSKELAGTATTKAEKVGRAREEQSSSGVARTPLLHASPHMPLCEQNRAK